MILTSKEILMILELISDKHGFGYSSDAKVSGLQAKLSILLELASRAENKNQGE